MGNTDLPTLGQNLYFHYNHPIKWIRLVGVIVAVDVYDTRWIMILDDSSGSTIEVTCRRPKSAVQHAEPTLLPESKPMSVAMTATEGISATDRTIDLRGVDVGTIVKVKGGLGSFRGEKQILLERISIIRTTNEEVAAWHENSVFRKDVLENPWIVTKEEEHIAKRKAEGLDSEQRSRAERKKRRRARENQTKTRKNQEASVHRKQSEERVVPSAEETAKLERAEKKRAQEKLRRQQEFENLRMQKEEAAAEAAKILELEEARKDEQKRIRSLEEKRKRDEDLRVAAESDRKERVKRKRDEEKRLREREFERLKGQKSAARPMAR